MKTISTAESCTGGKLAASFTKHPGASDTFKLGVVTYSNESKHNVLGIPMKLIQEKGAVSEEVARLMAENVRKLGNTDIGLSTTGIAGPDGGTAEKPVGTVLIGIATSEKTTVEKLQLTGNREEIQNKTIFTIKEKLTKM